MADKDFIHQRICIYAGKQFDPSSDLQVVEALRTGLGIRLPQKRTLDEALAASNHEHEIIGLIIKYREL